MARPYFDGEIHRFRVTLCLREGEHDDLIAAMQQAEPGNRAATVITMMYRGVQETAVSTLDEAAAADALENLFF
jgi:hypothetical protein